MSNNPKDRPEELRILLERRRILEAISCLLEGRFDRDDWHTLKECIGRGIMPIFSKDEKTTTAKLRSAYNIEIMIHKIDKNYTRTQLLEMKEGMKQAHSVICPELRGENYWTH